MGDASVSETRSSGTSTRRSCQGKAKPGSPNPSPPRVRLNSSAWNSSENSSGKKSRRPCRRSRRTASWPLLAPTIAAASNGPNGGLVGNRGAVRDESSCLNYGGRIPCRATKLIHHRPIRGAVMLATVNRRNRPKPKSLFRRQSSARLAPTLPTWAGGRVRSTTPWRHPDCFQPPRSAPRHPRHCPPCC